MRCQYLLTNVKYNNSYNNTPYFETKDDRNKKLINKNFNTSLINFDFGNILTTTCVINDYNNENYMIVKYGDDLYFYFVTDCDYIAVNQYRVRLELDVISQYCVGIGETQSFAKCYIERGHCDRFRYVNDSEVIFNVNNESLIIEPETNLDKVTKRRHEVKIKYSSNSTLDNWLNDNVLCWQYMYIDTKHSYKLTATTSGYADVPFPKQYEKTYGKRVFRVGGSLMTDEYTLCCTPIYKNINQKLYLIDKTNLILANLDSLEWFRKQNDDNEYIYNIKYSIIPPVDFDDVVEMCGYYIEDGNLYINSTCVQSQRDNMFTFFDIGISDVDCVGDITTITKYGKKYVYRQHNLFTNLNYVNVVCRQVVTNNKFMFKRSELKDMRSVDFEPKILVDCKTITLRDSSNGEYCYPTLYAGNNVLRPLYNESMNITNNNYYFRLGGIGIIPETDKENWHGVANTVDYSQQIANNNYANFIANNKNFLLTKKLEFIPKMFGVARGNITGLGDLYNVWKDLDNLENRPNSMKNVNDSVELNLVVNNGIKLYVDEDEAREVDINRYYNYLYNYGYKVNRIDYIHNYINTRRYFNYVKARIEYIDINMPDIIERKIKEIFGKGIRLWNDYTNMYNYEKENYEKWL